MLSDEELLRRASAGDLSAFDQLYDRYQDRAFRLALSICPDRGRAEDAIQEAFLAIWRSAASYRAQRGTVAAWLLTVVRHRAIDVVRRDQMLATGSSVGPDAPDPSGESNPARDALRNEQHRHFQALLGKLPDAQNEVITLAFYGQLSHREIAEQLGLPNGTVKGRMRLGMDKLRLSLTAGTTST